METHSAEFELEARHYILAEIFTHGKNVVQASGCPTFKDELKTYPDKVKFFSPC